MAQFLLSVHHGDTNILPEGVEVEEMFAAVGQFNQRLTDAGALVFAGGLMPASSAVVAHRDGSVTDGPYLTGEEYMGGFWVIDVADAEAALAWAKQALPTGCSRTIEVRPFQEV